MYLHQKIIRIYADTIQNHTLPGVFPNFWRAVYIQYILRIPVVMPIFEVFNLIISSFYFNLDAKQVLH